MSAAPVWTIRRGSDGLEQSVAAWGLQNMETDFQNAGQDKVSFQAIVAAADGAAIFNDFDTAIIYRTAPVTGAKVSWFSGLWTKTPRDMAPNNESLNYELSGGPWWYLAHCVFQTQWLATNGITSALLPVYKALAIVGLNPSLSDLVKMSLFDYIDVALNYCLNAGASQGVTPFAIGTISETDFVVPYEQVKNASCAQIIQHMLRWVPDSSLWIDYSTVGTGPVLGAPTINIVQRPALTAVNLPAFGGVASKIVKLTPRTDLQVTGVVCTYDQTNTIDGQSFAAISSDVYPPATNPFGFRVLAPTADLQGGSKTYQRQDVTVAELPAVGSSGSSGTGVDANTWAQNHIEWLYGTASAPSVFDSANVSVDSVLSKDLWAQDPYASGTAPTGFSANAMVNELIAGAVTKWMTDDQDIFAAYVVIGLRLLYSGTDAATAALFSMDPANPGTRIEYVRVKATNASTQTYTQLASLTPSEPIPTGLAQNLYNALSVLHYEGSIELTEQECSGRVRVGNVLNLTGSFAAWAAMNAQVISVSEHIDTGVTTVRFGPSKNLGLDEYVDLLRAARGRILPWTLNERNSGNPSSTDVIGHTHSPHSSTSSAPGGGATGKPLPFAVTARINPVTGAKEIMVNLQSTLYTDPSAGNNIIITGLNTWIAVTGTGYVYLKSSVTSSLGTPTAITAPTIATCAPGGDYSPYDLAWNTGAFVENDGASPPNQTIARVWIADYDATAAGAPAITQRLTSHLYVKNTAYGYLPAIYPFPLT